MIDTDCFADVDLSRVVVLDTARGSHNVGDQIIVESVLRLMPSLARCPRIATHQLPSKEDRTILRRADMAILLGTNILDAHIWRRRQWRKGPLTTHALAGKVVFLGVGWADHRERPDRLTRAFLEYVSASSVPVAARDSHTMERAIAAGVAAVNTCCPTTWSLPDELAALSTESEAVVTVTDYRRSPVEDNAMLRGVGSRFRRVLFWPQSAADLDYAQELNLPDNVVVLPQGLETFEGALVGRAYVGTRLHAGIRAMQLRRPALVVEVDNRARDIAADVGLPTVQRTDQESRYADAIEGMTRQATVDLPVDTISCWLVDLRKQLTSTSPAASTSTGWRG